MNLSYDKRLLDIEFFNKHKSYLPFVGDNYDEFKILQISESHYCTEIKDHSKYGIRYFKDWHKEVCAEIENEYLNGNLTRKVCDGVVEGINCFSNFDNPLRSFCKNVLEIENVRLSKYNNMRNNYSYFAFMNFYQLPAFFDKIGFTPAFYHQAKEEGLSTEEAYEIIENWRKKSVKIIDNVISILKPKAILFASFDAWEAYDAHEGEYKNDERMIRTSHPGRPWHNHYDKLDGKSGKEVFEDELKRIYKSGLN